MKNGRVVDKSGNIFYYRNDFFHRIDGPAVERADGTKEWWQSGKYHREDGPAVEWADGIKEYWLNNVRVDERIFQAYQLLRDFPDPKEVYQARDLLEQYLYRLTSPIHATGHG